MRRSPLWLVATLLAAACDQPVEPNVQAIAGRPASAQDPAERTFVFKEDGSHTQFEECFGEEVFVEWHNQVVVFTRRDATGNLHLRILVVDIGTTFTGLNSGTVWTLHGPFHNENVNGDDSSPEAPGAVSFVSNQTLTSPGATVNQRVRIRFHLTINANETVTVDRFTFEVVCK
jgi:hypothetical protein